ncbi:TlpA family protein disulfide reductase [Streptomyces sp. RY43-2]|uniref:TlpA family protein disulfide reductase n=1 Tax=Streptomyces macrolidinus TaxID=2952607 RepID=A0ABT0ZIJ3_9ACTN|nr:TlpA disulfide reductase family protein [Streptomyces macrolidinus]MCN9243381.1 TlpA family protein disulfide reductase [Streptomyces macrolidinus]
MHLGRALHLPLAAALVTAAALSLTGCDNSGAGGDRAHYVTDADGISTVRKADRQPAGAMKGETLDGKRLDVADLRGKVVVMNVWGSWCVPCRAEIPNFVKVAKAVKGKGVEFVGINTREASRTQAVAFEKDFHVDYPSLYDPTGKLVLAGFPKGTLNPQTLPSTIVLDQDGKIAARSLQGLSEERLRKMIDAVLADT